jgi:threonylcarbamoyladenosine tRNA methylthiotransferase MtaB
MTRTYAVVTFGCRVNQADSQVVEAGLRARGVTPDTSDRADLVIVNTCSVTASADQGTRQAIRRIGRRNPAARIVVTGCHATRCPDEIGDLPNVVRVVPNSRKDDLIAEIADDEGLPPLPQDGEGPCGLPAGPGLAGRTALTLRVQTGCEEHCSYCVIPRTRGAQRSLPLARVRREIEFAVQAGYREIVITGVHLGSYGRDLGDGTTLVMLVRHLAGWPADVRFRISSLEPMDCPPELVDLATDSDRIAPHFHLPLQHGTDDLLRAMGRPYTVDAYTRLLEHIHRRLPHAAIGTDLIAGFPGEQETHVDRTCRLLEGLPLSHLHVFPYSSRPGTAASRLPGEVEGAAIRDRSRRFRAIGEMLARRFRVSQAGRTHRALVVDDGSWAVTGNYLRVPLAQPGERNTWVDVTIPGAPDGQSPPRAEVPGVHASRTPPPS